MSNSVFLFYFVSLTSFQDNYSGLHLAVEAGKSAVVETLLGHGAQVHIRGKKSSIRKRLISVD